MIENRKSISIILSIVLPIMTFCATIAPTYAAQTPCAITNNQELIDAFYDGGDYILTEDISVETSIVLGNSMPDGIVNHNSVTIDFNGFFVSTNGTSILEIGNYDADITFNNSKTTGGMTADKRTTSSPVRICFSPGVPYMNAFTINGGTFSGRNSAIHIGLTVDSSSIVINCGTFKNTNADFSPIVGDYEVNGTIDATDGGRTIIVTPIDKIPDNPTSGEVLLNVPIGVPKPEYLIEIPAVIDAEKLNKTDTTDPDRVKNIDFEIKVTSADNLFNENKIVVIVDYDSFLKSKTDDSKQVPFVIKKSDEAYVSGDVYAEFFAKDDCQKACVQIDSSKIKAEGDYSAVLNFSYSIEKI